MATRNALVVSGDPFRTLLTDLWSVWSLIEHIKLLDIDVNTGTCTVDWLKTAQARHLSSFVPDSEM